MNSILLLLTPVLGLLAAPAPSPMAELTLQLSGPQFTDEARNLAKGKILSYYEIGKALNKWKDSNENNQLHPLKLRAKASRIQSWEKLISKARSQTSVASFSAILERLENPDPVVQQFAIEQLITLANAFQAEPTKLESLLIVRTAGLVESIYENALMVKPSLMSAMKNSSPQGQTRIKDTLSDLDG